MSNIVDPKSLSDKELEAALDAIVNDSSLGPDQFKAQLRPIITEKHQRMAVMKIKFVLNKLPEEEWKEVLERAIAHEE